MASIFCGYVFSAVWLLCAKYFYFCLFLILIFLSVYWGFRVRKCGCFFFFTYYLLILFFVILSLLSFWNRLSSSSLTFFLFCLLCFKYIHWLFILAIYFSVFIFSFVFFIVYIYLLRLSSYLSIAVIGSLKFLPANSII